MGRRTKGGIPAAVSRRGILAMIVLPGLDRAQQLDRQADAELSAGRHAQAERLAHEAAAVREAAR